MELEVPYGSGSWLVHVVYTYHYVHMVKPFTRVYGGTLSYTLCSCKIVLGVMSTHTQRSVLSVVLDHRT